uniref:Acyl CoA oxidase n=1 Tax=Gambierdiscus pacificus TaxID=439314 RepID=A0A6M5KEH2_9DINO|nr:acyl CoA oxidase [Gambierdiscus pacificus]
MKWWPTGIQACTHAAVMAQLVIDGVSYGFHGFFVQLRDDKGQCMPGIEIGEIGPKFDPEHNYIGYCRFSNVRIPRFNMFAKNQQVTREGEYMPAAPKLSKFKYISMMSTRVAFVGMSAQSVAKTAVIATRYACVRHQGFKDTTAENPLALGENRVIEYKMQQYRAFRAIGLGYMFHFTSRWIGDYLARVQKEVSAGNEAAADELPELHASCAGLKVWATLYAHEAMEDMRRSCGGQGFLRSSALGDIVTEFGVAVTGEGEQVILSLQVARYLIKAVSEQRAGRPLAGTVTYLEGASTASKPDFSPGFAGDRLEQLVQLYKERARHFTLQLESRFLAARNVGKSFDQALNHVAVAAYKASETHCVFIFARNFLLALDQYVKDPAIMAALRRVAELVLLQLMREHAGDWLETLTFEQLGHVQDRIDQLLAEVRPDCIGLTDGFGFSDGALKNSTLGRYDGNVYEAIYERAKQSPLNSPGKPMVAWEHFKEVLDLDFLREGMRTQRVTGSPASLGAPVHGGRGDLVAAATTASKL